MALVDRSEFVGLDGLAHLCTGGEAPWHRAHDQACLRFGRLKSGGMAGRDQIFAVYRRAKSRVARMLNVDAANVAFLAHASEGLNQAVRAVDWRSGDNAVFADLEYPSLIYPAAAMQAHGVEARVIRTRDHYLAFDRLAEMVDGRTRLVLISLVSYLTGQRVDLARCAELARSRGAWLAVDATHALGVAPVPGELCDFVVSSCYKWLLGTHGVGIFAYDRARVGELAPATIGWHSTVSRGGVGAPLEAELRPDAARLEAGNPGLLSVFVLDSALDVLERLEPKAVLANAIDLGGELIDGLRRIGVAPITPDAPDERAGNVCFLARDGVGLAARLAERGVLVWGGDGRIRISPHVHNDRDDVARCLEALRAVGASESAAA